MASQFLASRVPVSRLVIERSGVPLATAVEVAGHSASRRRGLLGRDQLAAGAALVIAPCQGVHTFGMKFVIDIVAVNRDGVVIKMCSHVPARRIVVAWTAFAIIEMPAGQSERTGLRVDDRLIAVSQ